MSERVVTGAGKAGWHHDRPYRRLVLPDDLVTDQAVADASGDRFHHAAIAKAVGDLTLSSATPVNIALFGPWGSGKSTFYHLMKQRIEQQDSQVAVAYYDAWKYGGQDLKRNFIQSIGAQLDIKRPGDLDRELTLNQEQSRLRLRRWFKYNWASIMGAFVVGFTIASLWVSLHAAVIAKWVEPKRSFLDVLPERVGEFGLVLAAILTALLLGPKAIESAVVKTTRPAIDRDDQFSRMFSELVRRVKKHDGAHRLVVFIDELDRCEADDVVATLVDLKTFLDEDDCVFVVAADREVLEHALRRVPQAKPVREDDPYYSTPGAFIDKIFQHQIALPPLRAHALSSFAHGLVGDTATGLWRDLRDADPTGRLFDDVVYILVPAHVTSPRRVKVLLNNYATSARIAESRHINWINRARELAFLTVLETEFPAVASALVRFPQLLGYLRGVALPDDLSVDRRALITQFKYDPKGAVPGGSSVSGTIVRDQDIMGEDEREALSKQEAMAKQELARQLTEYLDKLTVVSGLSDPRPDLFYLRVLGYDEGLTDPALGEMIDMAAERQPAVVVNAFRDQPAQIKRVAVHLLVKTLATERGTGQANVLEAACRITQELDADLVGEIAHLAPEVLTHMHGATWRPNALPGAVYLAAHQQQAASQISQLMDLLDPTEPTDAELLIAALPALEWTNDDAAQHIHAKVAAVLPTTSTPLTKMLRILSDDNAERGWDDVAKAVATRYGAVSDAESAALFEGLTDAVRGRSSGVGGLLWIIVFHAQNQKAASLVAHIHAERESLLPRISEQHRICATLYQIELSPPAQWTDWLPYVTSTPAEGIGYISQFARDAATVVVKAAPTSLDDLTAIYTPLSPLITDEDADKVFQSILTTVPAIPWGDATDTAAIRRQNLDFIAEHTMRTPGQRDQYAQSQRDSLEASITTQLPTMTAAAPMALFNEWRQAIPRLPADQAQSLDQALAKLTAPTSPVANVEFLRLRIAARLTHQGRALGTAALLPVAGQPTASVMANEWLQLGPTASSVAKVHESIPMGTRALSLYAARLTPEDRTTLWIALEKQHGSKEHLKAAGEAGVTGEAIRHMAPKIVDPAQQWQRDVSLDRLLVATFAEPFTKAEQANGATRGHKEASALALRLVDRGGYDNTVLAGRLIIHSGGVARGAKTKLHKAFTDLANGKQSRNFTQTQATALSKLKVLTPKKKGRMAWLYDRLVTLASDSGE